MTPPPGGLRRWAFAGALAALAVVVCYVEQIPWLELQSVVVFAAGYLLGARMGALVGALAMGFFSAANPYGLVHPLVFATQVLGRAVTGLAGGWAARIGLPRHWLPRSATLGAWALAVSLFYDLLTNLGTGVVFGQLVPTLVLGTPWALLHAASNVALFAILGGPLLVALDSRRALLGALVVLLTLAAPAQAQTPAPPETLRTTPLPPDTVKSVPAPAPVAPETRVRPVPIAATLVLDPVSALATAPVSTSDAFSFLGAAPSFYEDGYATEPLTFAGMPPGWMSGQRDGARLSPWSSPWPEPGAVGAGARSAWTWSATPSPAADTEGELDPGGRGSWRALSAERQGYDPFSSAWVSLGRKGHSEQGFLLDAGRRFHGFEGGARWSAWSRHDNPLGEMGDRGAHGLDVELEGAASGFAVDLSHAAFAVAAADFDGFQSELRRGLRSVARIDWGRGRGFVGLSAERVEERLQASGPFVPPLSLRALDLSASAWAGLRFGDWKLGPRWGWSRQSLVRDRDGLRYDPGDLESWFAGGFAEGALAGGRASAAVDVERAAGVTHPLARARWDRAVSTHLEVFAGGSSVSAPTLVETGASDPAADAPAVERPHGWTAEGGLHWKSAVDSAGVDRTNAVVAAPGPPAVRGFDVSLAVVGWNVRDAGYPAFGLFAREIVEADETRADGKGVAVAGRAQWTPLSWIALGGAGYAAGRTVPAATDVGPDFRALLWAGPRWKLFRGSLDLSLRGEVDIVGSRPANDEILPAIARPGARLVAGFGDAWLVLRATDLDDVRHPLPGRRFDGGRLFSPGRVIRLYGEWRFLN